jgi:5,10-methylene-tetrahydrofolate dehydrogenase/methenyl tetrahydrofolate cyclohydrolase
VSRYAGASGQFQRLATAGILGDLKMQDDLKGKGAVVTGAASGIGKPIATAFIEAARACCSAISMRKH